jgi:hypothetical protein
MAETVKTKNLDALRSTTDAEATRFTFANDWLCDYARPNEDAGLHKHTIASEETHWLTHCLACGRIWEAPRG